MKTVYVVIENKDGVEKEWMRLDDKKQAEDWVANYILNSPRKKNLYVKEVVVE